MRQIQPIARTFRRQLRDGIVFISKNWALRRILYLFTRLECLLSCEGDVSEQAFTLTTAFSVVRLEDPLIKTTIIFNDGIQPVIVMEAGVIVARVETGARQKLQLFGKLKIQAKADVGTTDVRVVTIRRCACGDPESPYDSGFISPTGGDLI